MILQTSFAKQIETVITLAGVIDLESSKKFSSVNDLKHGYRALLQSLGQRDIRVGATEPSFITNAEEAKKLRILFSNDSLLDDKTQAAVINDQQDDEAHEKEDRLVRALSELALYSAEHSTLFNTVITDIFALPSNIAKGGSTSQAIGVIWANPKISYTTPDMIEILIHELTHHAMFLDELRYTHYSYSRVFNQSTWARSAILNVARPLDKVLHSIVVAAEVLLFRDRYLGHPVNPRVHPPTRLMVKQLKDSISSTEQAIARDHTVFHPRATELLENARNILNDRLIPLLARLSTSKAGANDGQKVLHGIA
ncbi:MAG: aKG-HExxH-type peptide beta-hydroxylase [Janthinobacterium lividum]